MESSGVYNPKWWKIQTSFMWLWNVVLNLHLDRNMGLRTWRVLSFLSFLYIPVFRENRQLHVWGLKPSSTGMQVKLKSEETEMVAVSTKIAKQDLLERNQNKIYLRWYRVQLNIAELYNLWTMSPLRLDDLSWIWWTSFKLTGRWLAEVAPSVWLPHWMPAWQSEEATAGCLQKLFPNKFRLVLYMMRAIYKDCITNSL